MNGRSALSPGITARYLLSLLCLVPLLCGIGCGGGSGSNEKAYLSLDENRSLWETKGIRSYRMAGREFVEPFTHYTFQIEVRDGAVVSSRVAPFGDGDDTPREDYVITSYGTVDRLFERTQRLLDREDTIADITYDPTYGYPSTISTRPSASHVADGGGFLKITEFQPL